MEQHHDFPRGTLLEYINLTNRVNLTEAELFKLIKQLSAREFGEDLLPLLDWNLGNIDNSVSGGEKKKLDILRTMLKKCDVMIFDEPTASLDSYSKNIFYNLLKKVAKDNIIIVISHDNDIIHNFDNIIKL